MRVKPQPGLVEPPPRNPTYVKLLEHADAVAELARRFVKRCEKAETFPDVDSVLADASMILNRIQYRSGRARECLNDLGATPPSALRQDESA